MVIYGVALLAGCMMLGLATGDVLGQMLGIEANLGGVGIAMLLLIFATGHLKARDKLPDATVSGINFWNAMYIPIVVAMAASQNVAAALSGGTVALLAGALAVVLGLAMVPVFAGKPSREWTECGASPTRTHSHPARAAHR